MMDCFDNIIGFTNTECNCFDPADLGANYNKSNSGLFMDQLPESSFILSTVKGVAAECKKIGDMFTQARAQALSSFNEKIMTELGSRFTVKQNPYTGLIGQNTFTGPLASANPFIGSIYEMQPLKGGMLKVNKIYVSINQTIAALPVEVWKAYLVGTEYQLQGDAPLKTITVDTVANQATAKDLSADPLLLPLADDSAYNVYYLFLIDRSTGFQAMDNKASCGCNNQYIVERWLIQGGIEGTDKNHLQASQRHTGSKAAINGIVLDAEIKCSDTGFVCDSYNANPYIKVAIEYAILYQSVSNLLTSILRSDSINRFALTKREQMATDAAILHNKFKSRVTWIAENIDMRQNNCFVCNTVNEIHGPYKAGIRF